MQGCVLISTHQIWHLTISPKTWSKLELQTYSIYTLAKLYILLLTKYSSPNGRLCTAYGFFSLTSDQFLSNESPFMLDATWTPLLWEEFYLINSVDNLNRQVEINQATFTAFFSSSFPCWASTIVWSRPRGRWLIWFYCSSCKISEKDRWSYFPFNPSQQITPHKRCMQDQYHKFIVDLITKKLSPDHMLGKLNFQTRMFKQPTDIQIKIM